MALISLCHSDRRARRRIKVRLSLSFVNQHQLIFHSLSMAEPAGELPPLAAEPPAVLEPAAEPVAEPVLEPVAQPAALNQVTFRS